MVRNLSLLSSENGILKLIEFKGKRGWDFKYLDQIDPKQFFKEHMLNGFMIDVQGAGVGRDNNVKEGGGRRWSNSTL